MKQRNQLLIGLFIILLSLIVFVENHLEDQSDATLLERSPSHRRVKRYLSFQNGSRILFRILQRDNIIKVNSIFGHAWGFRANIDLLQPPRPRPYLHQHTLRKRQVYETIEQLLIQQGFDGRACILKMMCDASKDVSPEAGMLFKLFKLIFSHKGESIYGGMDVEHMLSVGCGYLNEHCPFTMMELTPYTDL